jgi:hypothetical protein
VVETGSEFCPHHGVLVEKHGAEALKRGEHLPARRKRIVQESVVADTIVMTTGYGTATIDPASVRPMLAAAAAENAEQLKASLLEAAGSAVSPVWLTVECSNCGERSRVEAPVPDVLARVAAELLLRPEATRVDSPPPRRARSAGPWSRDAWRSPGA